MLHKRFAAYSKIRLSNELVQNDAIHRLVTSTRDCTMPCSLIVCEKGLDPWDASGSGAAATHAHSSTDQSTAGVATTASDAAAAAMQQLTIASEDSSSGNGSTTLNTSSVGVAGAAPSRAARVFGEAARLFAEAREQEVARVAAAVAADLDRPWYYHHIPPESHARIQEIASRSEQLMRAEVLDHEALAAQGQAMLEALGVDTGPNGLLSITMRAAGARSRARESAAANDLAQGDPEGEEGDSLAPWGATPYERVRLAVAEADPVSRRARATAVAALQRSEDLRQQQQQQQ